MTGMRTLHSANEFEGHAPCFGDLDFAVADDRWKTVEDLLKICEPVLYVCGGCPHRAACIRQVVPTKSAFAGICGGRIWLNGVIVRALPTADPTELPPPVIRKACGSSEGSRAHRRASEQQCPNCAPFRNPVPRPVTEEEAEQFLLLDSI
ncbi:hypothetical protein ACFVIM_00450 [Streptomyces sp. NPDC057638]|uniref:hypothetical protein n=1 Tax=Streptomyces sp. NPDC057638 TaxID=3346190 RepID=UPI0036AE13EB